jgi:ubiquinone/menaquinone biosynthesis C-methylase UbiE
VYEAGNEMPSQSLRTWCDLIASYAPMQRYALLDVGAGTGMFTAALVADERATRAVGVDASAAMVTQAPQLHAHRLAHYIVGDAAALPIAPNSFDLALLSRVIHHVPNRRQCALELARAMRPGGRIVVRTTLRERLDALVYQYWPRLHDLDQKRFPSLAELIEDFEGVGMATVVVDSLAQPVQASLRAYHNALTSRPQSKFDQLDPEDFTNGLSRLRRDAEAETDPCQVSERYDMLVFENG